MKIHYCALIFSFGLILFSCRQQQDFQNSPNVILIISDQWSTKVSDGSGNYSNGILTPGIDQLASEGIRFNQSYSTYPLCTPARASLFTGLYSHKNKVDFNLKRDSILDNSNVIPTLGKSFKEAGYKVAYFGKEHAGGYGYAGSDDFGSMTHSNGGMLAEGSAYDPIFTKDAIKYVNDQREDHPFFMILSLINPHDICKVLWGKVAGATFADAIDFAKTDNEPYLRFQTRPKVPENHKIPYEKGMILHEDFMYEELSELSEDEWRRFISAYQLLIENTDWLISQLLDTIKEKGLDQNTIIVFTSDHGEMSGSHKLIGKTTFYEESSKTPLIIKYPKLITTNNINNRALTGTIDIMPTILDLAGLSVPNELDGKSLKNEILNQKNIKSNSFDVLYSQNQFGRMVRFDYFKYVRSSVYGETYEILYDLKKDPLESENLINNSEYDYSLSKGRKLLDGWLKTENISLVVK